MRYSFLKTIIIISSLFSFYLKGIALHEEITPMVNCMKWPHGTYNWMPVTVVEQQNQYAPISFELPFQSWCDDPSFILGQETKNFSIKQEFKNGVITYQDSLWQGTEGIEAKSEFLQIHEKNGRSTYFKMEYHVVHLSENTFQKENAYIHHPQGQWLANYLVMRDDIYPGGIGKCIASTGERVGTWRLWDENRNSLVDKVYSKQISVQLPLPKGETTVDLRVKANGEWFEPTFHHQANSFLFYIDETCDSILFTCGQLKAWYVPFYSKVKELESIQLYWIHPDDVYSKGNGIAYPLDFIPRNYALIWDWKKIQDELGLNPYLDKEELMAPLRLKYPNLKFYELADFDRFYAFELGEGMEAVPEDLLKEPYLRAVTQLVDRGQTTSFFDQIIVVSTGGTNITKRFTEVAREYGILPLDGFFAGFYKFDAKRKLLDKQLVFDLNKIVDQVEFSNYSLNWHFKIEFDNGMKRN